jgi:hypothetical protein
LRSNRIEGQIYTVRRVSEFLLGDTEITIKWNLLTIGAIAAFMILAILGGLHLTDGGYFVDVKTSARCFR